MLSATHQNMATGLTRPEGGRSGDTLPFRRNSMRDRWPSNVPAGVGVLLCLGISASAAEIQWTASYEGATKAAADKNALVMADFYTDW